MMSHVANEAPAKIQAYIESLPDWSKDICSRLRSIILAAHPDIREEWKWGPHYSCEGMVCGFGAFQKHVKFTFFNGAGLTDTKGLFNHCKDNEFSRSIKFVRHDEINETILRDYILASVELNRRGFKRQVKSKEVEVPPALLSALSGNKKGAAFFENLSYGYKKEFVEYFTSAKQEKTRDERTKKIVALCAAGKRLNDKYK